MPTLQNHPLPFKSAPTDRERVRVMPWPAKRLARRHGLRPATALVVAELAGFAMEAR
jgi:hypothetical protein